jgi:glycosyltransferase involved in cell wall biosynthesis
MKLDSTKSPLLILIPAWNEEGAIAGVIREIREHVPGAPILVVDDCSKDDTRRVAEQMGAAVISVPVHLGLGGCVQAGYKLAFESGFSYVIRVDGDGQHNPADIPRLYDELVKSGFEMVIGSRYKGTTNGYTSVSRGLGIQIFRLLLWPILGQPVRDPTSGFVGVNRQALEVFAHSFPLEYPEIETLVVLQRKRFRFLEVPCQMRPRQAGRTSITPLRSLYYLTHVMLGVFVNILKFDGRRRP